MEHWEELCPGGLKIVYEDSLFRPGTDSFLLASLSRKWIFMDSSPKFLKFFIALSYVLYMGFPCGSAGKESACHVGNLSSIPLWFSW